MADDVEQTVAVDAAKPEPAPTGQGEDVGARVVDFLKSVSLHKIAEDIETRLSFGEKKYGTRLKANNGRDFLMDAYQEVLDFLNYSMQGHMEGNEGYLHIFELGTVLANKIRTLLDTRTTSIPKIEEE
jgi:hypothetical protein